jgi:hypothetical protein
MVSKRRWDNMALLVSDIERTDAVESLDIPVESWKLPDKR